jgi:hypothetical protein
MGQLERASQSQFANRGQREVGRGDKRSCCWVCTPPRKIRRQFHEYKHTSLALLAGESSCVRRFFAQRTKLVMLWLLRFTSQPLSRIVIESVGGVSAPFFRAHWRWLKQELLTAL